MKVRLLHSGHDDSDSLQRANNDFSFATFVNGERFVFDSYPGVPDVIVQTNAFFVRDPVWYRNFLYLDEQADGRDCVEDLASPGEFGWDLNGAKEVLALAAKGGGQTLLGNETTGADFDHLRTAELTLRGVEQFQRQNNCAEALREITSDPHVREHFVSLPRNVVEQGQDRNIAYLMK